MYAYIQLNMNTYCNFVTQWYNVRTPGVLKDYALFSDTTSRVDQYSPDLGVPSKPGMRLKC